MCSPEQTAPREPEQQPDAHADCAPSARGASHVTEVQASVPVCDRWQLELLTAIVRSGLAL